MKKNKIKILIFFLFTVSFNIEATVFNCKMKDGTISYQEFPCSDKAEKQEVLTKYKSRKDNIISLNEERERFYSNQSNDKNRKFRNKRVNKKNVRNKNQEIFKKEQGQQRNNKQFKNKRDCVEEKCIQNEKIKEREKKQERRLYEKRKKEDEKIMRRSQRCNEVKDKLNLVYNRFRSGYTVKQELKLKEQIVHYKHLKKRYCEINE